MFSDVSTILDRIEARSANLSPAEIRASLRELCLDDFGELLLGMPNPDYPRISVALPAMASDEVQRQWTGGCGIALLHQSVAFVRAVWHSYERTTGKRLAEARILDFGCGYGRLLRLMMYFADESRLFGCDPWTKAIALCKESGITNELQLTHYHPASLPYPESGFDLVFAFSVFTHTSLRAATAALGALSRVLRPGGLLAITIRPVEYWCVHAGKAGKLPDSEVAALHARHVRQGFSFRPHGDREPVDGDITYGDVSMSPEFIERSFPDWKILGLERNLDDPYQRIVYMQLRD